MCVNLYSFVLYFEDVTLTLPHDLQGKILVLKDSVHLTMFPLPLKGNELSAYKEGLSDLNNGTKSLLHSLVTQSLGAST